MIRRPPRSTRVRSSAASDVYKRTTSRGAIGCAAASTAETWSVTDLIRGPSSSSSVRSRPPSLPAVHVGHQPLTQVRPQVRPLGGDLDDGLDVVQRVAGVVAT